MRKVIYTVASFLRMKKLAEMMLNGIGTDVQDMFVKASKNSKYHADKMEILADDKVARAMKLVEQAEANKATAKRSLNFSRNLDAMFEEKEQAGQYEEKPDILDSTVDLDDSKEKVNIKKDIKK